MKPSAIAAEQMTATLDGAADALHALAHPRREGYLPTLRALDRAS